MPLVVLTGKTGIGKTTFLYNRLAHCEHVGGFLSPLVQTCRSFYLIQTKQYIEMQLSEPIEMDQVFKIGKYLFSKSSFKQVEQQFIKDFESGFPLVLLDEYGPLELNKEGFGLVLDPYLEAASQDQSNYILVVVRESLKDHFANKFKIETILEMDDFNLFLKQKIPSVSY